MYRDATVFREQSSKNIGLPGADNVHEQIFVQIFAPNGGKGSMLLMDALVLITFWIFFNAGKNLYEQPTIYGVECPLFQCSLTNKTKFPSSVTNIQRSLILKITF